MQLDFLGSTTPKVFEQTALFDEAGKAVKLRSIPDYSKANAYFQSLTLEEISKYKSYWESVTPSNDSEKFQRYLFAFMSVHSTWESNIKGYQAIKGWQDWFNMPSKLKMLLVDCGAGLHNQRLRFIESFSRHY